MNKLVLAIVGGVIVVGAGVAVVVTRGDDDNSVRITNSATGDSQEVKTGDAAIINVDACDVLTESVAKQVIGAGAEKGDTSAGNVSSDDVSVSNCVYTYKSVTTGPIFDQLASTDHAGLLVRSAKTQIGVKSNKTPFTTARPSAAQDVSGFGDDAYFNPTTGQLNILKGGNWYILSKYKGTSGTATTVDEVKVLATALKANLR